MSMMMWQLMSGGMQQPSGSGGLYGGFAGGMPDWSKFFGQGNTAASRTTGRSFRSVSTRIQSSIATRRFTGGGPPLAVMIIANIVGGSLAAALIFEKGRLEE